MVRWRGPADLHRPCRDDRERVPDPDQCDITGRQASLLLDRRRWSLPTRMGSATPTCASTGRRVSSRHRSLVTHRRTAELVALSADGGRVIVSSNARLTFEDIDNQSDLFAIQDGSAELLSIGPSGGNGDSSAGWPARVAEPATDARVGDRHGRRIRGRSGGSFQHPRAARGRDTDDVLDLYANVDGATHLVSTGTNDGPGRSFGADTFRSLFVSPDGSRVFFVSNDPLAVEDTDTKLDVYEWHDGRTTVVPRGTATPEDVILIDELPRSLVHDGSRVFVQTTAVLTPDDLDTDHDLYGVAIANAAPDCDAVVTTPSVLRPANNRLFVKVEAEWRNRPGRRLGDAGDHRRISGRADRSLTGRRPEFSRRRGPPPRRARQQGRRACVPDRV